MNEVYLEFEKNVYGLKDLIVIQIELWFIFAVVYLEFPV